MYSKYLFAIEENNEDWIVAKAKPGSSQDAKTAGAPGEKMVNIQKLRMLYVLIKQLRQYQRVTYNLRTNPEVLMQVRSNNLPFLDEKAMYETSQKVQPREEKK